MNLPRSPHPAPSDAAPTTSPWPVFWIASAAVFLVSLDSTMLYSIFGALRASFPQASAADISWVINAYSIVYAAMLIPAGGLADAHGPKRVFLLGASIFIGASAACGLAGSVTLVIAARAVQAIGAAMLMPASLSIILAAFPRHRRALVVSAWGAVGGFASAIGPSLGSYMTEVTSWSWAFFINVPIGLLSLWFGSKRLLASAPADKQCKIDVMGMVLLITAVGLLSLAIVECNEPTWTHGEIASLAVASVMAAIGFTAWARHAREPLVSRELFRHPTYNAVLFATLTFGMAFAMTFFALFFYLTNIWHYDAAQAGLAMAPGPLSVVPVAIFTGRLAGRYGHRPFLVSGALLYALSGVWLWVVLGLQPAYLSEWLPLLLMTGTSVGLVIPSLSGAAVAKLPAEHYAVGSAVNQAARQIAGAFGVSITVTLLGHSTLHRADFSRIYGLQIVLALITAVFCLFVRTRPLATPDRVDVDVDAHVVPEVG